MPPKHAKYLQSVGAVNFSVAANFALMPQQQRTIPLCCSDASAPFKEHKHILKIFSDNNLDCYPMKFYDCLKAFSSFFRKLYKTLSDLSPQ